MTQQITSQAASRREHSRQPDGKFGAQEHSEAAAVTLERNHTVQSLDTSQLGQRFVDAQIVSDSIHHQLHVTVEHDPMWVVPADYAAPYHHNPDQVRAYLDDRKHVIGQAISEFYGGEAQMNDIGDTSFRYQVSKELNGPPTETQAYDLIDQEFEPDNLHVLQEFSAHIAARLQAHDEQKLPHPDMPNEKYRRQFVEGVIDSLYEEVQSIYDGCDDEDYVEVEFDASDRAKLRSAVESVYADNAGDIEAWNSRSCHDLSSEALLAPMGCAEDIETAAPNLNTRVIGRRLERSFAAEMPKIDPASGRVKIDDDGIFQLHPQVFDDFAQRRANRITQETEVR